VLAEATAAAGAATLHELAQRFGELDRHERQPLTQLLAAGESDREGRTRIDRRRERVGGPRWRR
jgi:hypothetical protein